MWGGPNNNGTFDRNVSSNFSTDLDSFTLRAVGVIPHNDGPEHLRPHLYLGFVAVFQLSSSQDVAMSGPMSYGNGYIHTENYIMANIHEYAY